MKYEKFDLIFYVVVVAALLLILAAAAHGQAASGGAFTLEKTVVAGGGAMSQNQSFGLRGTIGQTIAGNTSTGNQFSLKSGFWTPENSVLTAAAVTVGGRVTTAAGQGIRNALVTITFPTGETRMTVSRVGGNYRFGDVEVGATYIFTISSKRFVFSNPAQTLTIVEERDDIDFVADN